MTSTKILVFADSLAMPRKDEGEILLWEETWPFIVKRLIGQAIPEVEVINKGKRARNSHSLIGEDFTELIDFIEPDICVIQIGVVDSMPRVFSRIEKRIMNMRLFPKYLKNKLIRKRSNNRAKYIGSDPLKNVEVEPSIYYKNILTFLDRCEKQVNPPRIILIPVLIAHHTMELKSPGSNSNAEAYNLILERIARERRISLVDPMAFYNANSNSEDFFLKDGYHLSSKGNIRLAGLVSNVILQLLPEGIQ